MNAVVRPTPLTGEICAPSSKSEAHRALICAAFAPGATDIDCTTTSDDIDATVSCLEALGARIARTERGFRVRPVSGTSASDNIPAPNRGATLDCRESGSTLRFLLPVVCALGCEATMTGQGRLSQRPLSPLYEQLLEHGVSLSPQGEFPLSVGGRLTAGRFLLPGNVSSQFVTGLLLSAPLLASPLEVVVSEPVESRPYLDITQQVMKAFGVDVSCSREQAADGSRALVFDVCASGYRSPGALAIGGDWSNAAFWLAAGAIGKRGVAVRGLDVTSAQGDRQILAALSLLGAHVLRSPEGAAMRPAELHPTTINVSSCPDLVPPLAAVASFAPGTTRITGASRLRLKESDRLETVSAAVNALGGCCAISNDDLLITGSPTLAGGIVDAAGDHRIAMMAAVMATRCTGPTTIVGAECVSKSYPNFFKDFSSLGGVVETEA